jgi:predicted ferric reductase
MNAVSPSPPTRLRGLSALPLAVLYIAALAVPLVLALATGLRPNNPWIEASAAAGMVAGVGLMLQFVTSGRFEALSGRVGIDVTMAFHKWSARALAAFVVVHPILFVVPDFLAKPSRGLNRFGHLLVSPRYLAGVVAVVLVIALVTLAVRRDKLKVPYETWRASHGLLALMAAGLVTLHALRAGTYSRELPLGALWPALSALVLVSAFIVYAVRAWRMRKSPWRVAANRMVADGLWEVTLKPRSGPGLVYRAGQFAWLAFAPRAFPLFDHPFSIASAPAAGPDLSFLIKESGDFTRGIGDVAVGTPVGLDAPHGSFVVDEASRDAVLLFAGGVGIAPVRGIIRELAARRDPRKVRLVYAGARPSAMIDPQRLLDEAAGLDIEAIFLAEEPGEGWPHDAGRVTPAIIKRVLAGLDPNHVSAMLCGPGVMMCIVCDQLRGASVPVAAIRYERFDYADAARSVKDRLVLASFAVMGAAAIAVVTAFALR